LRCAGVAPTAPWRRAGGDHGGGVPQPHLALVAGCRATLDLIAHGGPARREHRGGVSQPHLALVAGCRVTLDLVTDNGPPGIHDLMHGMSPYESPPFLVPAQSKSIGTEHLLDSGLGAIGTGYWDWPG